MEINKLNTQNAILESAKTAPKPVVVTQNSAPAPKPGTVPPTTKSNKDSAVISDQARNLLATSQGKSQQEESTESAQVKAQEQSKLGVGN